MKFIMKELSNIATDILLYCRIATVDATEKKVDIARLSKSRTLISGKVVSVREETKSSTS